MFCRKCGKKIPDDSEFCYKCGAPVVTAGKSERIKTETVSLDKSSEEKPEEKNIPLTSRRCEFCGKEVFSNEEFCSRCRAPNSDYIGEKTVLKKITGASYFPTRLISPTKSTGNVCPNCGNRLEYSDLKYCPFCSEPLNELKKPVQKTNNTEPLQTNTSDLYICKQCGHTVPPGNVFCPNCNADVPSSSIKETWKNIDKEYAIKLRSAAPLVKAARNL